MSQKKVYIFLLWLIRGVTVCLTLLLFYSIFVHFFTDSGKFEVVYDFEEDSEYISHLEPWQRLLPPEETGGIWSQRIKENLVYFNVQNPLWFEKITAEIVFKNEHQNIFEIGARVNKDEGYQNRPLQNKFIDGLKWKKISDQGVYLYQKEPIYETVKEFSDDLNDNKLADVKIGEYFYRLPDNITDLPVNSEIESLDYLIAKYSPPLEEDGWLNQTQSFNVNDLYQDRNGKLRFRLVAQGLGEAGSTIQIREIRIKYEKPMISLNDLRKTAEYFIDKTIEKVKNEN